MIKTRNRFSSILIILAIASLFCIGLNCFNNKYTANDIQPTGGQIKLSEENLNFVHFLIKEWAFYPDKLLTPEMLHSDNFHSPMTYVNIGEQTTFISSTEDTDSHGCGTYVMHLWLPDSEASYALELPEIFSAYTLYINGEKYLQLGNPEISNYQAATKSLIVPFRANKHVELVLAVSDYSHFYSGMVYPPIFGIAENVLQYHDYKYGSTLFVIAIGFLLATASIYLGIRMKKQNALLFSFLSSLLCLTLGFPYLHGLFELSVFPWYALELLCIYLMPVFIITLHNRICDVSKKCKIISVSVATANAILALCYGLTSSLLPLSVMKLFSCYIAGYTILLAVYLLSTAFHALEEHTKQVRPIYYASITYACLLIWDRIFPNYEPIYYGWFTDWGNLILVMAIGYSLMRDMIHNYLRNLSFAEEHRQMTKQLTMQQEYNRQISNQMDANRRLIHDFRHHLRTLSVLSEKEKSDELQSYLDLLSNEIFLKETISTEIFSDIPAVNALLHYYYTYAKKYDIQVNFQWIPDAPTLSEVEYCTVLGNLLENAIEACRNLTDGASRKINLYAKETEYILFICVENTYDGVSRSDSTLFLSRKRGYSSTGVGLESVRDIVEKHDGTLDIFPEKEYFRVGIDFQKK